MYGIAQPIGILVRMLAVLFLVTATYNPSGYSYWHWAFRSDTNYWALKIFLGLLIIFGFVFCTYATWRSLRLMLGVPLILLMGQVSGCCRIGASSIYPIDYSAPWPWSPPWWCFSAPASAFR